MTVYWEDLGQSGQKYFKTLMYFLGDSVYKRKLSVDGQTENILLVFFNT